ncbi:MAG: hypothetical protein CMJ26_05005 [Phycisphaerae bacterium]|nr:hypothetical protein [Phycisphaerae bacterium]|tara:strand:- start:5239 stop:6240 length:1002 start_codon:yes stop_codon:yes gene_type:complete
MTESKPLASRQALLVSWIGTILIRIVVPAWIIFGALQKAVGGTPKSLPRSVLDAGSKLGIDDHFLLLASLVSIEFYFVAFMLFCSKFAKRAGALMLATFLLVLAVEMFGYGNFESCGCFGEKSLSPMAMFGIDLALLLGILLIKPRTSKCGPNKGNRTLLLVSTFTLISCLYTFNAVMQHRPATAIANNNDNGREIAEPLPASWYPKDISSWVGKSIDDVPLFDWVEDLPSTIREGKQYVIFYSLTCDHCEALLWEYFEFPTVPTTLVAIPQSTNGFNYDGAFENPCHDCDKTELRIGVDWIVGAPLVVALDNGAITCATENEDYEAPACLIH